MAGSLAAKLTSHSVTLELTICPSCGGAFGLVQGYKEEARRLGHFKQCWTCPYCKTERGFGDDSEKERLQKEKQVLEAQAESLKRQVRWADERTDNALKEAKHFRLSRDGVRGALIKVKKRVGNGSCPCCNRHFENLRLHMASKHPDYKHAPKEMASASGASGSSNPA